jgi:hypothetical protein
MLKKYLMIGLVGTLLSSTPSFATLEDDSPLFIDGQNVRISVRYLRRINECVKETQAGVRRFTAARKTLGTEKNVTRYSRMDFKVPLENTHLSTLRANTVLTFQWNSEGDWVYPPNTNAATAEVKPIFTISPVTKNPKF